MYFISPTEGKLDFLQTFNSIIKFIEKYPQKNNLLVIGSDSKARDTINFVTTILIYRKGCGARFYYRKNNVDSNLTMRQRIYQETLESLKLANKINDIIITDERINDLDIEVHLDVGPNGKTNGLINEVVGMISGSGYKARIKPLAYGASNVADRYT